VIHVLPYLNKLIEDHEPLTSLLSVYVEDDGEEGPAIAFQTAPEDMDMPYLVTRLDANVVEENNVLERMVYNIDVFVDNGDDMRVLQIQKILKNLLKDERLPYPIGVGVWYENSLLIPDEDPGVRHLNMKFLVRYL
jgi:hypothetical protein